MSTPTARNGMEPGKAAQPGSADFQSAVSPISNRQRIGSFTLPLEFAAPAEWNSAIQQIGNLRYDLNSNVQKGNLLSTILFSRGCEGEKRRVRRSYSQSSLRDAALRVLMLVTLVAICARVPAQDYVTNNYVTNRLSLSGRVGLGISARFKGIAVLPVPALNRTTPGGDAYNYDDGYVLSDTSGNFGGQTWYWGYDNSASQISGNNILLSRNSSASIGSSEADDKPGYGAEVLYSRMLGAKGNLRYGFEAAINYLNFSVNDSRPRAASLTRVTDAYPFTPGTTPPAATPGNPYQGSFDGPGFVIGDTPVSSSTTVAPGAAVSNGHREFDADIWGIRVGPYLEFPLGEKFKLSVSGGLAAALISAEASWTESITISGTAGPSVHGSGRNTDFVLGGYLAGNAAWEINERWSIVGSVQYQYLGRYDHSFGGRAVEADLTHGIFITLGVGYKF